MKYVKNNFLAAGAFTTLDEANAELPDRIERIAGLRIHGTTRRQPLGAFVEEKPALLGLPTTPYEIVLWHQATVHRDSHVYFDRRLYSVPWPHLGQTVWVRATPASVVVYLDEERLATHERCGEGRRSTQDAHLPEHRRDLRYRSIDHWFDRATVLGEPVERYVRTVYDAAPVLSKLREVQAIVLELERVPVLRAQAACERAVYFGNLRASAVAKILEEGLYTLPLPAPAPLTGVLDNPRFARSITELMPKGDLS